MKASILALRESTSLMVVSVAGVVIVMVQLVIFFLFFCFIHTRMRSFFCAVLLTFAVKRKADGVLSEWENPESIYSFLPSH